MKKSILTINSLSHHHWADRPEELLREAAGGTVVLIREPQNVDPNAVRVHFLAEVAGYVCAQESPEVAAAMDASACESLLGKVVGTVTEPYYKLKVACTLPSPEDDSRGDLEQNRPYEQWEYTGPLMPLSEDEKCLQGAMEFLKLVLLEQLPWDSQAQAYLEKFLALHQLDCSEEIFRFRGSLLRFLASRQDKNAARLEAELHELSRHEYFDALTRRLTELHETPEFADMMRCTGRLDYRLLQEQVMAFPGNLAAMRIHDPKLFARRLHYVHPPRQALRKFLSGLALMDDARRRLGGLGADAGKRETGGFSVDRLFNYGTINDL